MAVQEKSFEEKVNSYMWDGEKSFIALVEKFQKPEMVVVEIGAYDGSSTRHYIETVKKNNGHVFIIDTFEGTPIPEHMKGNPKVENDPTMQGPHNNDLYEVFLEKFKNYADMMTIIKGWTKDCIPQLPDNCDLIFIDADHTYLAVKEDIELSLPKVKPGGILSGHDLETFEFVNTYTEIELKTDHIKRPGQERGHHPGVSQAVYEKFGITDLIGKVWYVKVGAENV